ncbi:SAM domain and HD, partial [Bulinus truncatus]
SETECWKIIQSLKNSGVIDEDVKKESKIFNDPIHGHIVLHPVSLAIVDTPEFQRMRNIKQLGMCYYVYPGASHNRFEHSLGVSYLAGQFARTLQENQPYLGITEKDILCVEIAGLCHDLGHGPFSHVFDEQFIPAASNDKKWTHEKASLDMLDFIITRKKLMEDGGIFRKYSLDQNDVIFIKEMIYGPLTEDSKELKGRQKHKHYLYEIVSNKRNGIDVDKWDYFARDCHHLGIKNNFDYNRYMKFARVIKDAKEEWQICIRDKEISNLYNMFYTRLTLHKTAYQHRVTKTFDAMIRQALLKADDDFRITGTDGKELKMSESIGDMCAYSKLTDSILFQILDSKITTDKMQEAKNVIQRIFERNLYTVICESEALESQDFELKEDTMKAEIINKVEESDGQSVEQNSLEIQIVKFDFGMKSKNPVEKLLVYSKTNEDVAFKLPKSKVSRILGPVTFSETFIRVVYHNDLISETLKTVTRDCVIQWQTAKTHFVDE